MNSLSPDLAVVAGLVEAVGLGEVVGLVEEEVRWMMAQVVQLLVGAAAAAEERWRQAAGERAEGRWRQAMEARAEARAERWKRAEVAVVELLPRATVVVQAAQIK